MRERNYCFAGLEIRVEMPEERMYEREYRLAPFASGKGNDPHTFRFECLPRLPKPEGKCICRQPNFLIYRDGDRTIRYWGPVERSWETAYARVIHEGKDHTVQLQESEFPGRIGARTVLDAISVEHYITRNRGILFHCSYIDIGGAAVLFTAPSQTGKSTQADLWEAYRGAEIINGDRAAVRIEEGAILAEGIPYSGSSPHCKNRSLPLKAIVYLSQAPVTTIRKLRGYEAFARIWEGVSVHTWDKQDMELASETVETIAGKIPVYHMPCTPDESAVIALERELNKLVTL